MSLRLDKVNSQIRKSLVEVIQNEIDDPKLGLVSITRVNTSPDLREAKVYFSVWDNDYTKVSDMFKKMSPFIRRCLARKVRLKYLPNLSFFPDESIQYSVDIYTKIEEVKSDEENRRNNKKE